MLEFTYRGTMVKLLFWVRVTVSVMALAYG